MTLKELIGSFNADLPKIRQHLFTAYSQWASCKLVVECLWPGEIAPQSDYQMNVTVRSMLHF